VKFPELTPLVAKKNLKLACCDRCNRAEWVEPAAQVSFCKRCSTRRRPPTKPELEQFRQQVIAQQQAEAAAAAAADTTKANEE
jgi:hypothetical protein